MLKYICTIESWLSLSSGALWSLHVLSYKQSPTSTWLRERLLFKSRKEEKTEMQLVASMSCVSIEDSTAAAVDASAAAAVSSDAGGCCLRSCRSRRSTHAQIMTGTNRTADSETGGRDGISSKKSSRSGREGERAGVRGQWPQPPSAVPTVAAVYLCDTGDCANCGCSWTKNPL